MRRLKWFWWTCAGVVLLGLVVFAFNRVRAGGDQPLSESSVSQGGAGGQLLASLNEKEAAEHEEHEEHAGRHRERRHEEAEEHEEHEEEAEEHEHEEHEEAEEHEEHERHARHGRKRGHEEAEEHEEHEEEAEEHEHEEHEEAEEHEGHERHARHGRRRGHEEAEEHEEHEEEAEEHEREEHEEAEENEEHEENEEEEENERTYTFSKADLGKTPKGWTVAKTGKGKGSQWKVVADPTAPSGTGYVLAQTAKSPRRVFNLCVVDDSSYRDVEIEVCFKAVRGKIDQGGGVVWRYQDENNYYIARMNPLESNYRFYKVVNGRRTQLATKEGLTVRPGEWHTLEIKCVGNKIRCKLDGKTLLEATDNTFKKAGKVGLWTKADARTYFDKFEVEEEEAED